MAARNQRRIRSVAVLQRGKPSADRLESRRVAILDAATEVFLKKGFSKTNISDVAKRAGTSRSALCSLYPNKAALFAGVLERRVNGVPAHFDQVTLRDDIAVKKQLRKYGLRQVRSIEENESKVLFRQVVAQSEHFPNLGRLYWDYGPKAGHAALIGYLRLQVRRGVLHFSDIDVAAEQFIGSLVWVFLLRSSLCLESLHPSEADVQHWVDSAVDAFFRAHSAA